MNTLFFEGPGVDLGGLGVHVCGLGVDLGPEGADVGGLGVELGNLGLDPGGWRAKGHSPVKECHPPESKNHEKALHFTIDS